MPDRCPNFATRRKLESRRSELCCQFVMSLALVPDDGSSARKAINLKPGDATIVGRKDVDKDDSKLSKVRDMNNQSLLVRRFGLIKIGRSCFVLTQSVMGKFPSRASAEAP